MSVQRRFSVSSSVEALYPDLEDLKQRKQRERERERDV